MTDAPVGPRARLRVGVVVLLVFVAACASGPEEFGGPTATDPLPSSEVTSTTASTTASTAAPSSTSGAPSSTASTTAPPSTEAIPRPSGFDEWPAPAAPAPSLEELPHLLPADPIPGADDAVRFDWDADVRPDRVDYLQVFVADDGASMLLLQSNPGGGSFTPEELRTYVDVPGWDTAFFSKSAPGYANLSLIDDTGLLHVAGRAMSDDSVLAAARTLQRRAQPAAGWEIPGLPMFSIHEGWANGPTFREFDWYRDGEPLAELDIAGGLPDLIDPGIDLEHGATITEVQGAKAIAIERPGFGGPAITLISWSPQPEVVVYFGMRAPLDDALAVARSLGEVDLATWEAAGHPPVGSSDGCNSFRC